jgi:hypothetical protein
MRPHLNIKRVAKETLDILESRHRAMIIKEIIAHPSRGKTFKLYD